MARSPYDLFQTDPAAEQNGVDLDYGSFYITVARAGGANTRFKTVLRAKLAPYERAMATKTMDDDLADRLGGDAFAETVVRGWGMNDEKTGKPDPKLKGKMLGKDGELIDFSVDAVKALFADLPDLRRDVMEQSSNVALFRQVLAETSSGN